jgi:hypothetical protein
MVTNGGRLLLILTSRDAQTAAQLAQASGLSPAETLRRLQGLLAEGFIVAGDDTAVRVYRLTPKGMQPDALDLHPHILLVEDDLMVRELVVELLEDEGYAVIAAAVPVDAVALLQRVSFDLVITDGFSKAAPRSSRARMPCCRKRASPPSRCSRRIPSNWSRPGRRGSATSSPSRSTSTPCSGRSERCSAVDAPSAAQCVPAIEPACVEGAGSCSLSLILAKLGLGCRGNEEDPA